jgi:hypothetical protein
MNTPVNPEHLQNPLLKHALNYASLGWPVFPLYGVVNGRYGCNKPDCKKNMGEHPRTLNGFKDASTNARQITQTFSKLPNANIDLVNFSLRD